MQTVIDEIKKKNPMYADIIDKIPSMSLEEQSRASLLWMIWKLRKDACPRFG